MGRERKEEIFSHHNFWTKKYGGGISSGQVRSLGHKTTQSLAKRAVKSPFFRNYIVIPTANIFHILDVKVRMRILNLGKVSKVKKLDEKKAIDTGAQMLSEFLIYSFGASLLIWEYTRQAAKEEVKKEAMEQEKQDLLNAVSNIEFTVAEQAAQIRELTRITYALRDDLVKANNKHSGPVLGFGKKDSNDQEENKTVLKDVVNDFDDEEKANRLP